MTKSFVILTLMAGLTCSAFAGLYGIEVLPTHPTDNFTFWSSINDQGSVVGETAFGNFLTGGKRIMTYRQDQGMNVVVDNLRQSELAFHPIINNAGQIAYSHNLRPGVFNDLVRTYRYTPGVGSEEMVAPNPNLSYFPQSMNNLGDIVGQSTTPDGYLRNSVIWRNGEPVEVMNNGLQTISMTDDRTLVGQTPIGGFVRREGQDPQILTYPTSFGWASTMNTSGQVLGGYFGHAWLWAPDLQSHIEIPTDGGILLNDGSVSGATLRGSAQFESLGRWTPEGGFEEITQLLDSRSMALGFDRWSLRDVNQRGEILASAWIHNPDNPFSGPRYDIIIRPVPEPSTMLAFGAGLAALLRRRRR